MTKPHITTPHDCLSARYKELHRQLAAEMRAKFVTDLIPILYDADAVISKTLRKRQASQSFRQTGE